MGKPLSEITEETKLSQQEFDKLLVYNTSLPTGQTIGKQWRRDWNGVHYLCEYDKLIDDGKFINIKTTRIKLIR